MRFLRFVVFAASVSVIAICSPAGERKPDKPRKADEGYISTADGTRLFYQKVGNGKATVIIPAALFLARDFRQLAEGRTLIFYDMRNRGRSDAVKDMSKVNIQEDVS